MTAKPDEADLVELELLATQPSHADPASPAASHAVVARVTASTDPASQLVGATVLACAIEPCGQCEICRRGGAAVCPHAKPRGISRVSSRWLVPLGDGLELAIPAAAAVPGDAALAYTLYARTNLAPRDPVVIVGATAITRWLVAILRAKSITPITIGPGWLAETGAIVAAEPADVPAAIASQGLGNRPLRVIAIDRLALETAVSLAGPRATLTALATGSHPFAGAQPALDLLAREVTIVGVAGPHPDLVTEVAALCAKGDVELAACVTEDAGDPTRSHVIRA